MIQKNINIKKEHEDWLKRKKTENYLFNFSEFVRKAIEKEMEIDKK
jgi:hypothetical protein